MNMQFDHGCFGIVGAGLIGTSFAKAIMNRFPQSEILFNDANQKNIEGALAQISNARGVSLEEFKSCDLVIICTPVSYIADYAHKLSAIVDAKKCTITDVGSTKVWLADKVANENMAHFVPGHLLSGGTSSGPQYASSDIVYARNFSLTPHQFTHPDHTIRADTFLKAIGLNVIEVTPQLHDEVLAITSHIPHMLSYALVHALSQMEKKQDKNFSLLEVNSFKQMTHFVKSDPEMWADILISNHVPIQEGMKLLLALAERYIELAEKGDKEALMSEMNKLKDIRNLSEQNNG